MTADLIDDSIKVLTGRDTRVDRTEERDEHEAAR